MKWTEAEDKDEGRRVGICTEAQPGDSSLEEWERE